MTLLLERFPINPPTAVIRLRDSFGYHSHHGTRPHSAIDIFAPEGTPVVATTAGYVLNRWRFLSGNEDFPGVSKNDSGGWFALIVDDNRYVHYYAHMRWRSPLQPGARVVAGMKVGWVGNTGMIAQHTEHHLHYQVYGRRSSAGAATGPVPLEIRAARDGYEFVNPFPELNRLYCIAAPSARQCR